MAKSPTTAAMGQGLKLMDFGRPEIWFPEGLHEVPGAWLEIANKDSSLFHNV